MFVYWEDGRLVVLGGFGGFRGMDEILAVLALLLAI